MRKMLRLFPAIMILMLATSAHSQFRNTESAEIRTSAQCEMCKESIERMLTFERGVRRATLDMETKVVTVMYNGRRTDQDRLRKAIARLGYDADKLSGDPEAYAKLPDCCKLPEDRRTPASCSSECCQ